jgi:hypothetical protein
VNRGSWKQAERSIAALLGGERVPVTGRQRGDAPDIAHPTLSIEVKKVGQGKRPMVTERLKEAIAQAEAASVESFSVDGKRRHPIAIIEQTTSSRKIERFVVMRFDDFLDFYEGEVGL